MGHQVEGLLDRILYTAGVAAGFGVRRDSQKPVDSGRGPLGGLADRLQIGLEVVVATLVDLLPGQLGIPAADKERVVQFMRDPRPEGCPTRRASPPAGGAARPACARSCR